MSTKLEELHGSVGSVNDALETSAEPVLGGKKKVRFNFGDVEVNVDNSHNSLVPLPATLETNQTDKVDLDEEEER
ncbi:MAG: hypothetical protein AAF637_13510, partial [Pseudomonadota bacterium]